MHSFLECVTNKPYRTSAGRLLLAYIIKNSMSDQSKEAPWLHAQRFNHSIQSYNYVDPTTVLQLETSSQKKSQLFPF